MERGPLICFEGCDKLGKTTLIRSLKDYLERKKISVRVHNFPDRQKFLGQLIDKYLKNEIQLSDEDAHELFNCERRATLQRYHTPDKSTVILDRYVYSGCAYSAAKGKLTLDWCMKQEKYLPKPDLIYYVKGDIIKASENVKFGQDRFENLDFQKKVAENFEQLFFPTNENVHVLDLQKHSFNEIITDVCLTYNENFLNVKLGPLNYF